MLLDAKMLPRNNSQFKLYSNAGSSEGHHCNVISNNILQFAMTAMTQQNRFQFEERSSTGIVFM